MRRGTYGRAHYRVPEAEKYGILINNNLLFKEVKELHLHALSVTSSSVGCELGVCFIRDFSKEN